MFARSDSSVYIFNIKVNELTRSQAMRIWGEFVKTKPPLVGSPRDGAWVSTEEGSSLNPWQRRAEEKGSWNSQKGGARHGGGG